MMLLAFEDDNLVCKDMIDLLSSEHISTVQSYGNYFRIVLVLFLSGAESSNLVFFWFDLSDEVFNVNRLKPILKILLKNS